MPLTVGETLTREPATYGGFADAIGGIATIVLAIIGLSGAFPDVLAGIATIVFGVALLIQGGAMLGEYAQVMEPGTGTAEALGGNTLSAMFLVGAAGGILGILALIGIHPVVLIPVAIIAFGTALVLSANSVWHLYVFKSAVMRRTSQMQAGTGREMLASEMASGSAGMQALAGLAAVVLGILALTIHGANGEYDIVLVFVAFLVLGATLMLTGSTLSGTVMGLMPHRSSGEPEPFGGTRPTQTTNYGERPTQAE